MEAGPAGLERVVLEEPGSSGSGEQTQCEAV